MALDAINKGDNYIREVVKSQQTVTINNVENVNDSIKTNHTATHDDNSDDSTNKDTSGEKKLRDAVTGANNKLVQKRTRCEFSYHEDVNRISIKVYDRETDKVLKEIPADETLEMLEKIWDLAGLLVDEKR